MDEITKCLHRMSSDLHLGKFALHHFSFSLFLVLLVLVLVLVLASPRDVCHMSPGPVSATRVTCLPGALSHDPTTCVTCPPGLSPGEVSTTLPACFPQNVSHVPPQLCRMSPRHVSYIHQESTTYLRTYVSIYLSIYGPSYLLMYLPTYLPIYVFVCKCACLA